MRQNAGEKKNWIRRAACALLVMVLISMQSVCGLYARFTVSDSGGDSARTAAFVFYTKDQENSSYLDLSGIQKPGDSRSYIFTVSNKRDGTVSEVAEKYWFTVQLNGSMPLKCTISKDQVDVLTANISETTQELPVLAKSAEGQFAASTGETHKYEMTVEWPKEKNDVKYASRSAVAEVLLTVAAEQLD